jgi:tetratricopeptide (TPR) repeat protein
MFAFILATMQFFAPGSIEEHLKKGEELMHARAYYRAIQEFSTAALMVEWSGDFSDLSAFNHRGNVYFILADYSSAIDDYTFVIDHAQNQPQEVAKALKGRCFSYGFLGDEKSCNADLERISVLFSQHDLEKLYREFIQSLKIIENREEEKKKNDNDLFNEVRWDVAQGEE